MKNMLVMALCASFFLGTGADASARSLEEILKEKGVITEADYQEAKKKNDFAYYEPGKGITVESGDGKYKAHVGGRLQARYTFTDFDAAGSEDSSDFTIRRMKVWLQGNVFSKNLKYKWQHNFGGGNQVLEDAYLSYTFVEPFSLTLGQFKPPQARQELTSSGSQLFVDRSLANETFNLGYDIGLMADGHFANHLVEYMAGVFNGNGVNKSNKGNDHLLSARIDLNPLGQFKMDEAGWPEEKPLLNLGASYTMEKMTAADAGTSVDGANDVLDIPLNIDGLTAATFATTFGNELDWDLWTANLHAKWMGATFGAEYYRLEAEPDLGDDWDADGYYVQAGYQIIPKTLELAARYSEIESTDDNAAVPFDKSETQFGVNYYFAKHNLKLQADYTAVNDDLNDDRDDDIVRLQAQIIF